MLKKIALTFVFLASPVFVTAALVDNGAFVTDTSSGTDYLKSPMTQGFSYYEVVTFDLLGFIASGWSLTSQSALSTLASGPDASAAYHLISERIPRGNY